MLFVCPKCMNHLSIKDSGAAVCPLGHSYDRSREGYYNLLLSNSRSVHGDNCDMVEARRRFLNSDHYLPFAKTVARLAAENTPVGGSLVDVGMGEGYYTRLIADALSEKMAGDCRLGGFDISKDACKRGAKRLGDYFSADDKPRVTVAVASAYKMPIESESLDTVVNVFSPLAIDETLRVLKKGGRFIYAIPNEMHLYELKEKLYDEPYKNEPQNTDLCGFVLNESKRVSFIMDIKDKETLNALFMMTPYAYRTGASGRARLMELDSLSVKADFEILVYERL